MFSENLTTFAGLPVEDWEGDPDDPKAFARVAYRLRVGYDDEEGIQDKLAALLDSDGVENVAALVIGAWHGDDSDAAPTELIEALVSGRDRLPNLRSLFIGDIVSEENEISWIHLMDLSPLLAAYPNLERLTVRGSLELSFGSLAHAKLKELIVQSGGLPPTVVHEVASAKLPSLEHLELWLGDPGYGGDATVEDVAPFLSGTPFPKLKYLGLKNSVIEDDIAGVVAVSPVMAQLEVLDLSEGTLGDDGARALLASPHIGKLKRLVLSHHFISKDLCAELKRLPIEVVLPDAEEPEEWGGQQHRFVSVSE